jgi:AraC family transcriptional regulator of adaptative response/methylated-DNA-[protein]-cysteine methyltransferase
MIDDPMTATLVQLEDRARDYHRMERALGWLADHWQDHPSLDEAAEAVGLSPFHFQRIFTRWAGVSPKTFVGAIAHAEARRSLEAGASVLDAAFDAGLSGPSRLHDLFIAQEAVTPGEARRRGEGLTLRWGLAPTPFGRGLFAIAPRGLAGLGFAGEGEEDAAFGGPEFVDAVALFFVGLVEELGEGVSVEGGVLVDHRWTTRSARNEM